MTDTGIILAIIVLCCGAGTALAAVIALWAIAERSRRAEFTATVRRVILYENCKYLADEPGRKPEHLGWCAKRMARVRLCCGCRDYICRDSTGTGDAP